MRVWIIRHAKAKRDAPTGRDVDRALTARGREQAAWLAAQLARRDDAPSRLLSSPATRALETARRVAEALDLDMHTDQRLIVGERTSLALEVVDEWQGRGCESLAIVGHNPTFSDLARRILAADYAAFPELRTGEAALVHRPYDPAAEVVRLCMDA